MPGLQLKKRPLSRYLKDYKHGQTHCSHCHKQLDRMALVFRGQIINKEAIAGMDQPIDDQVWSKLQHELTALCLFAVRYIVTARRAISILWRSNSIYLSKLR